MSESADERSRRVFCNHLMNFKWVQQISFFYTEEEDALNNVITDGKRLRKALARKYPECTFLWRLMLKFFDGANRPYWTVYVTEKIDRKEINKFFESGRVKARMLSEEKIKSIRNAVMNQKPHDLKSVLGEEKINRFSLLNARHKIFSG